MKKNIKNKYSLKRALLKEYIDDDPNLHKLGLGGTMRGGEQSKKNPSKPRPVLPTSGKGYLSCVKPFAEDGIKASQFPNPRNTTGIRTQTKFADFLESLGWETMAINTGNASGIGDVVSKAPDGKVYSFECGLKDKVTQQGARVNPSPSKVKLRKSMTDAMGYPEEAYSDWQSGGINAIDTSGYFAAVEEDFLVFLEETSKDGTTHNGLSKIAIACVSHEASTSQFANEYSIPEYNTIVSVTQAYGDGVHSSSMSSGGSGPKSNPTNRRDGFGVFQASRHTKRGAGNNLVDNMKHFK